MSSCVTMLMAITREAPLKTDRSDDIKKAYYLQEEVEITISRMIFCSDSKCVSSWIRGDSRRFKQFVAHHIGEIQETTEIVNT